MANSFQSPVSGEPSLGTPHPHYAILVNNADPTVSGYVTVDVSGQVPVGTNMIYVRLQHTSATVGNYITLFTDSTPTPASAPVYTITKVANVEDQAFGLVKLSSTRTFVYYVSAAAISNVYIMMFFYWC